MKTFSRIVRRRIEGALRLRMPRADGHELQFRPAVDPMREDIPVEVISLEPPAEVGVTMLASRWDQGGSES